MRPLPRVTTANVCRVRSSACDTLAWLCVRCLLCWPAFPLVSAHRSTGSAAVTSTADKLNDDHMRYCCRRALTHSSEPQTLPNKISVRDRATRLCQFGFNPSGAKSKDKLVSRTFALSAHSRIRKRKWPYCAMLFTARGGLVAHSGSRRLVSSL